MELIRLSVLMRYNHQMRQVDW
ncbi:hypothetical protein LINPERHAP2_LOCUS9473 [Linum perenne]